MNKREYDEKIDGGSVEEKDGERNDTTETG